MDKETPPARRRQGSEYRASGLELVVRGPDGVVHFPLCQESVRLGGVDPDIPLEGAWGRLFFHADQLLFEDAGGRRSLTVGPPWKLGNLLLRVQPEEVRGALLEGLSEPYLGRFWALGREVFQLGRPGKRSNQLSLEGCGVSREHARILALPEGYTLQVETARGLTELNGRTLKLGEAVLLREGDVLLVGEVRLRFRLQAAPPAHGLRIYSLGAFEVYAAGGKVEGRQRMACHVLARVAAAGGQLALERLLEDFWPELTPANARRRLTWHLCALRSLLGEDWVVRTAYGVQLKPGVWHDLTELNRALQSTDVAEALRLYRGPFLEDCYLDWAESLRHDLEARFVGMLFSMLPNLADPHLRQAACRALLTRDPHCQPAYLESMRADLELGVPQRALKTFARASQKLRDELGVEPGIELLREQQRARLAF